MDSQNNASQDVEENFTHQFHIGNACSVGLHAAIVYDFVRAGWSFSKIVNECPYLSENEVREAIKAVLYLHYVIGDRCE